MINSANEWKKHVLPSAKMENTFRFNEVVVESVPVEQQLNPLSTNLTKWSNTLQQPVGNSRQIVSVFDHFVGLELDGLGSTSFYN